MRHISFQPQTSPGRAHLEHTRAGPWKPKQTRWNSSEIGEFPRNSAPWRTVVASGPECGRTQHPSTLSPARGTNGQKTNPPYRSEETATACRKGARPRRRYSREIEMNSGKSATLLPQFAATFLPPPPSRRIGNGRRAFTRITKRDSACHGFKLAGEAKCHQGADETNFKLRNTTRWRRQRGRTTGAIVGKRYRGALAHSYEGRPPVKDCVPGFQCADRYP